MSSLQPRLLSSTKPSQRKLAWKCHLFRWFRIGIKEFLATTSVAWRAYKYRWLCSLFFGWSQFCLLSSFMSATQYTQSIVVQWPKAKPFQILIQTTVPPLAQRVCQSTWTSIDCDFLFIQKLKAKLCRWLSFVRNHFRCMMNRWVLACALLTFAKVMNILTLVCIWNCRPSRQYKMPSYCDFWLQTNYLPFISRSNFCCICEGRQFFIDYF